MTISMMSGWPTRSSDPEYRASLGAALRQLREARAITRSQLAHASNTPATRLGSIERGEARPSEEEIASVAAALRVNVAEILELANHDCTQRTELRDLLEHLAIPRSTWPEFIALDPMARDALVDGLRAKLSARAGIQQQVRTIENIVERDGVARSVDVIVDGILNHGLPPLDYLRMSVELDEMPGERIIFSDRLPISPATVPVDQLYLFRASYGMEPSNPMLLKWWAESRRSGVLAALPEYASRTIVPIDRLERYIRTGERGPNIVLSPNIVLAHLVAIIELLRTHPHFMIGLSEARFPIVYRIKGDRHVLASIDGYKMEPDMHGSRISLRFSRPAVADQFRRHFDTFWAKIPDEYKDRASVANWLEQRLPDVGIERARRGQHSVNPE